MRRLIVMASLLALVATACKLETNIGATINADGSGTVVTELGMDEEAQGVFLADGTDPFDSEELSSCEGARTREEDRGDLHFWIIECDMADITALENTLTTSQNTMLSSFDITVTDTLVSVSGTASAEDTLGSQAEGFDPTIFEQSISANLKITLPGHIISHNADSQSGNTLTWKIPVLGGTLDVQASSDPSGSPAGGGGGGFPMWLIAVIAVVVLGGGYYFWTQNKKKGGAAPTADTPPPAPTA